MEKITEEFKLSRVSAERAATMVRKIELEASAPSAILPPRLRLDDFLLGANSLHEEWFAFPPGESAVVKDAGLDMPINIPYYSTKW